MSDRLAFQTAARAGAMTLLAHYCASASLSAQQYRARPRQAKPPCFYIESITERLEDFTISQRQRTPVVRIRALWGRFDDGSTVDARDKFVDGFLDWVADNPHAFGSNSLQSAVAVADDPEFNFDDGDPFFSTVIALEGFAST